MRWHGGSANAIRRTGRVVLVAAFPASAHAETATQLAPENLSLGSIVLMAALIGVNVDRTISTTFVIGAALAAVAGFMVTLYYGVVDFYMGFLAGMKAFTAAVLGGIGSLPGAMLGGVLIGLIESLWAGYVNAQYKDVAVFGILMLVLMVRPNGLFGRPEIEKV